MVKRYRNIYNSFNFAWFIATEKKPNWLLRQKKPKTVQQSLKKNRDYIFVS